MWRDSMGVECRCPGKAKSCDSRIRGAPGTINLCGGEFARADSHLRGANVLVRCIWDEGATRGPTNRRHMICVRLPHYEVVKSIDFD